ncbi:hypothetical protein K435DRAFT_773358 [Dendrothele bispora CBS 962.96]|uniref:Hydrophobin n=1 Tax=Dendrothele bispora (strain CBS 962.96) TaxID=1314807 RepID=A0A4S8MUQ0_DENBC|nr:hypothetical protein K435DRAFT_773358 [Dendrothele bispora CBS 962.96]
MQFSKSLFTPIFALFAMGTVLVTQVNAAALPALPGEIRALPPHLMCDCILEDGTPCCP